MPMMDLTGNSKKIDEILRMLEPDSNTDKIEITQILEIVKGMQNKLDEQSKLITKVVAMLSKMVQDGEINKDTFNKLDEFLKSYYDNPYQDGKY